MKAEGTFESVLQYPPLPKKDKPQSAALLSAYCNFRVPYYLGINVCQVAEVMYSWLVFIDKNYLMCIQIVFSIGIILQIQYWCWQIQTFPIKISPGYIPGVS
jgi:hypothetical protein